MAVVDSDNVSVLSLKEFLSQVKSTLSYSFPDTYWVVGEVSEIRENASGHCFLELIEKNEKSTAIIEAKVRAIIYSNYYGMIKPYFMQETGSELKVGMKLLVKISLSFSEVYGLSCSISGIDPTFTVGDLAKKRSETIKQLKEDGIWDMNATLPLISPTQRIAVISSATAAGFGDFSNQLDGNKYGFYFYYKLFPAIVQGDKAAQSIIDALDSILDELDNFDAVIIIRGGGATTDLLAFDDYDLASHVAQFPLPIITGIGHERDESIVDMVAHTHCKTPTAVAAFLIDSMLNLENRVLQLANEIRMKLSLFTAENNRILDRKMDRISYCLNQKVSQEKLAMERYNFEIKSALFKIVSDELHKLQLKENSLQYLSPERIFERGYSFVTKNGLIVRSSTELKSGDEIETFFLNDSVISIVK